MQEIKLKITDADYCPCSKCKKSLNKDERIQDYYAGLMDGISATSTSVGSYDYFRGVSDGSLVFMAMIDNYRKELKHPLTTEIND